MMSDKELAGKIRQKWPQYSTQSDAELVALYKKRFPPKKEPPIRQFIDKAVSREIPVTPAAQKFSQAVTLPGRGMRGLGVTGEQLLLGKGLGKSFERGTEAIKPGYVPQPGEKLGTFAGGMADPINIGMGAIFPGTTLMKSVMGGAMMGTEASLLDQASRGRVNPALAATEGLGGAMGGGLAHQVGTMGSSLIQNAPSIYKAIAKIPKRATVYFKRNKGIENTVSGSNLSVEKGARDITGALQNRMDAAKRFYGAMASKAGVRQSAAERSRLSPLPTNKIADTVQSLKTQIESFKNYFQSNPKPTPVSSTILKSLLHARDSIDHHISQKQTFDVVRGGLAGMNREINQLIEKVPGGDLIRAADRAKAPVNELYDELMHKINDPEKAIKFLKETFEGEGPESRNNMSLLQNLEKMTGRNIVNNMFKVLTMNTYQQRLGGNRISRSIAGASPFLISALMRVAGVPFQLSLPLSAGMATASQSPALLGKMLRMAQSYAPYEKAIGTATGDVTMSLIRRGGTRGAEEKKKKRENLNP